MHAHALLTRTPRICRSPGMSFRLRVHWHGRCFFDDTSDANTTLTTTRGCKRAACNVAGLEASPGPTQRGLRHERFHPSSHVRLALTVVAVAAGESNAPEPRQHLRVGLLPDDDLSDSDVHADLLRRRGDRFGGSNYGYGTVPRPRTGTGCPERSRRC